MRTLLSQSRKGAEAIKPYFDASTSSATELSRTIRHRRSYKENIKQEPARREVVFAGNTDLAD
jgi:hypothetical protein